MKRALVTGGSGAIGSAICRELSRRGFEILVHANSHLDRAEAVAHEIVQGGGAARALAFDVADRDLVAAALDPLIDERPIQVLVNNAGIHDDAPFAGLTSEQWHRVIAVSLDGFFNVTQAVALPMMRTRWGRIVSITSVSAQVGNRGQANYAAAKGAIEAASRSLARELGRRGVTVNCVAPGIIASPMTESVFPPELVREIVPLQRAGEPSEVAGVVGFLASDDAAYITGQIIPVNGGMA